MTDFDDLVLAGLPQPECAPPAEPLTFGRLTVLLDELEARKQVVACAPDVYDQVREAVDAGGMGAYYRVVQNAALPDGHAVVVTAPDLEQLAPPVISPDVFAPKFHCPHCRKPTYTAGPGLMCEMRWRTFYAGPPGRSILNVVAGGLTWANPPQCSKPLKHPGLSARARASGSGCRRRCI